MKLFLNNIGIVSNSDVEINGLTIVTGPNNSGKSTIGKALHSIIDATECVADLAFKSKKGYIINKIRQLINKLDGETLRAVLMKDEESTKNVLYDMLYLKEPNKVVNLFELETMINEIIDFLKALVKEDNSNLDENIKILIKNISNLKGVIDEDLNHENFKLFKTLRCLKRSFYNQIAPVRSPEVLSTITVQENDKILTSFNLKSGVIQENSFNNIGSKFDRVINIENPVFLDGMLLFDRIQRQSNSDLAQQYQNYTDYIMQYGESVSIEKAIFNFEEKNETEEIIIEKKNKKIIEKINQIISGDIFEESEGIKYSNDKLSINNLSSGSKSILTIKLLLQNGLMDEKTMLILDEAESSLHPEWQNIFAEILVLIVSELNVSILLTTHSDNFVLAIDAFVRKYCISDRTNFYSPKFIDGQKYMVKLQCMDHELNRIYDSFSFPNDKMRELRNHFLIGKE